MTPFNESVTLDDQEQRTGFISPNVIAEFTYIPTFYKYDENKNYGNVPLTQDYFIF